MASPLFDVFVVGSVDQTPAGQSRLAVALSNRFGIPAATATRGVAERKLRVGQGLPQVEAQSMVRELQAHGATTVVRPSAPSIAPAVSPMASTALGLRDPSTPGPDPFAPPPSGRLDVGPARPPLGQSAASADPGPRHHEPFDSPPSMPDIDLLPSVARTPDDGQRRSAAAYAPRPAPADPFGGVGDLAPADSSDDSRKRGTPRAGSSARPGDRAGLTLDHDEAKQHTVRCPAHGLHYDRRKASGCRKCLEAGHHAVDDLRRKTTSFKIADYEDSALKRAFVGTLLALLVGFLPAAYVALRVGEREVRLLRDEQEVLARKPGSEDVLGKFAAIDEEVRDAHQASMRNTALVWLVVSGVSLAGWYRFTN
jgi:hypothetical protein